MFSRKYLVHNSHARCGRTLAVRPSRFATEPEVHRQLYVRIISLSRASALPITSRMCMCIYSLLCTRRPPSWRSIEVTIHVSCVCPSLAWKSSCDAVRWSHQPYSLVMSRSKSGMTGTPHRGHLSRYLSPCSLFPQLPHLVSVSPISLGPTPACHINHPSTR